MSRKIVGTQCANRAIYMYALVVEGLFVCCDKLLFRRASQNSSFISISVPDIIVTMYEPG
jgi:hypothetical protein